MLWNVATQAMLDAVEKGATDNQALTVGTVRALLEMALAKVEVGELLGGGSRILGGIIDYLISMGIDEMFDGLEFDES